MQTSLRGFWDWASDDWACPQPELNLASAYFPTSFILYCHLEMHVIKQLNYVDGVAISTDLPCHT
jgi:hypothetical protein